MLVNAASFFLFLFQEKIPIQIYCIVRFNTILIDNNSNPSHVYIKLRIDNWIIWWGYILFQEKTHAIFLGLSFLGLLLISSFANTLFLNSLNLLYQNQILVFSMIFMNNIIVISLIILGMTFYVKLVTLGFFKNDKNSTVIIDHPRIFSIVFSFIVLFLGILRGVNHFFGKITIELLPE